MADHRTGRAEGHWRQTLADQDVVEGGRQVAGRVDQRAVEIEDEGVS